MFNTGATISSLSHSSGNGTDPARRRSGSVGSLLRSIASNASTAPVVPYPISNAEWEVEPNEAHDDPFARPPPTPSSTTSTPGPSATPTRVDSGAAGSMLGGNLSANRLVSALEAIEEPDNGSPPNVSLDDFTDAPEPGPEDVERVMTPLPTHLSPTRTRSNSTNSSVFREHLGEYGGEMSGSTANGYATPRREQVFEPTTPHNSPHFFPDSPPRRRTDRRASSPARPGGVPGIQATVDPRSAASSPMGTPSLARNRSSSLRQFAATLGTASPGRLASIRRLRSSLRRRSQSPPPLRQAGDVFERPSESSDSSFARQGVQDGVQHLEQTLPRQRPSPPVGLAPPPSARLSVGSRKAWWKHMSAGSRGSASSDSPWLSGVTLARSASVSDAMSYSGVPSRRPSEKTDAAGTLGPSVAESANARWSGYHLPPVVDVSPFSSSVFLPLPRRSGSSQRKSLRRTESSPAMIEQAAGLFDPTSFSLAAASSKLSAGSFVTARSKPHEPKEAAAGEQRPEAALGIELDELNHLVQTFVPLSADERKATTPASPSASSADFTPSSAAFFEEPEAMFSPVTPATDDEFRYKASGF